MFGNFRTATLDEYIEWLNGYVGHGRVPTHYYGYSFRAFSRFRYVTGVFALEGEEGANARHIIVDRRAQLDPRKSRLGHNVLLYMAGYQSQDQNGVPSLWVPIFNDDAFLTVNGIKPHIERLTAKNNTSKGRQVTEGRRRGYRAGGPTVGC